MVTYVTDVKVLKNYEKVLHVFVRIALHDCETRKVSDNERGDLTGLRYCVTERC